MASPPENEPDLLNYRETALEDLDSLPIKSRTSK